jgi:hypothetical protein
MRIRAFAIGLALAWATIGGARATDVLFTITNTTSGKTFATFELPQNPMSLLNGVTGEGVPPVFFEIYSVPAVVNGVATTLTNLEFPVTGGFSDEQSFYFSQGQFYTWSENSPTFRSNFSVKLQDGVFGGQTDTVTVMDPPSPGVPELSTWAMLLLGFVGLSYAGYRKARRVTTLPA